MRTRYLDISSEYCTCTYAEKDPLMLPSRLFATHNILANIFPYGKGHILMYNIKNYKKINRSVFSGHAYIFVS